MCADLGLAIDLYQPFRDFEGMPDDAVRAQPGPRRAQVRPDAGAGRAADAGLLEHLAAGRSTTPSARPRSCTSWPSAPPSATCASATRRWPGAATSTLRAGLGHRRARRPPAPRPDPRQLPHPVAAATTRPASRTIPGEQDLLRADGRRADAGDGRAAVGAPLPQLPRPGPVRRRRASSSRCCCAGYAGPLSLEIFNDVFRETPNRRTAVDAMRSLLYLESAGARAGSSARRRGGAARRARRTRRAVRPAGRAALAGLRLHRVRASTTSRGRGARRRCWSSSASPRRPPSLEGA